MFGQRPRHVVRVRNLRGVAAAAAGARGVAALLVRLAVSHSNASVPVLDLLLPAEVAGGVGGRPHRAVVRVNAVHLARSTFYFFLQCLSLCTSTTFNLFCAAKSKAKKQGNTMQKPVGGGVNLFRCVHFLR